MVFGFNQLAIIVMIATVLTVTGCSKTDAEVVTSSISISGSLSLGNSSSSFEKVSMMSKNGDSDVDALALADYTAACATTSVPILSGTSAVASDGTFSVSIEGASGQ
ncbi:MAG: hypothetical protein ACXWC9_01695, partial [Pseudobdellovibrionaceae bacterium]